MIYRLLVQNYSIIIAVAASNASLHLGFCEKKSYLRFIFLTRGVAGGASAGE